MTRKVLQISPAQCWDLHLTQEQQRAMIGILDERYDNLWLRLQAMPLPRPDQFETDLARIVGKGQSNTGIVVSIDQEQLRNLILTGLQEGSQYVSSDH